MEKVTTLYYTGWYNFKQKWLTPEKKIAVLTAPFLANVVLITDIGDAMFLTDILGIVCAHLAYWGTLCIALTTTIGSIRCPELIQKWDIQRKVSENIGREDIRQLVRSHSGCSSTDNIDHITPKILTFENVDQQSLLNFLGKLGTLGYVLLAASSILLAVRVLRTLVS